MDKSEELRVCGGYDFLPMPGESEEDCNKRIKARIRKEYGSKKLAELDNKKEMLEELDKMIQEQKLV